MNIKQSYTPLQGKYSQGNCEDEQIHPFMMADVHANIHIRIKTVNVLGEAELTVIKNSAESDKPYVAYTEI